MHQNWAKAVFQFQGFHIERDDNHRHCAESNVPHGGTPQWKHVAISTLGQNNHAVRDERWRYIRYADGSEELYDHQTDPNEWNNIAAKPLPPGLHTKVIARLKMHLPKTNATQRGNRPKQ